MADPRYLLTEDELVELLVGVCQLCADAILEMTRQPGVGMSPEQSLQILRRIYQQAQSDHLTDPQEVAVETLLKLAELTLLKRSDLDSVN